MATTLSTYLGRGRHHSERKYRKYCSRWTCCWPSVRPPGRLRSCARTRTPRNSNVITAINRKTAIYDNLFTSIRLLKQQNQKLRLRFSGGWQINNVASNFFPENADELHQLLNDKITDTATFFEVPTRSPRLSQLKSVVPVFVVPGFKPKIMEPLYKHFFYPVFEAQLPECVYSIDELSETLVNVSKTQAIVLEMRLVELRDQTDGTEIKTIL